VKVQRSVFLAMFTVFLKILEIKELAAKFSGLNSLTIFLFSIRHFKVKSLNAGFCGVSSRSAISMR
jgi:hypothetical protein